MLKSPLTSVLKGHIKQVHEKVQFVHCGELIPVSVMNEHIRAQHTSNKDKRHKCDVCGKGFNDMGPFKDHKKYSYCSILGRNLINASIVQLVLQARGIIDSMKKLILDKVVNIINR